MTQGPESGAARPEDDPLAIAKELREFDGYRVIKLLGRGAQGVVYLAEDVGLGRKVAIKMLSSAAAQTEGMRERFHREAKVTSRLDHPNICAIHEMGEVEDIPYIVMQFVEGSPLGNIIEDSIASNLSMVTSKIQIKARQETADVDGRVQSPDGYGSTIHLHLGPRRSDLQDVVRLLELAARALHVAHEAGLIHRDIKPGNIIVTPQGDPVLLDFGLARDTVDDAQSLTQSGQIIGTPGYLAPEQLSGIKGGLDRRVDVYALGVTLFECLTLRRPFIAPTYSELFQIILNSPIPNIRSINPRIPRDLRTVIEKAMERDPDRRYQTALELAEDLRRVRAFEPILAKPASLYIRGRRLTQRHPVIATSVLAGVVAVVGVSGFLVYREIDRQAQVAERLDQARESLTELRFDAALEAIAQARELAPESVEAVELKGRVEDAAQKAGEADRRRADLQEAASARAGSATRLEDYAELLAGLGPLRQSVEDSRKATWEAYASRDDRAETFELESQLAAARSQGLQALQQSKAELDRAYRLESRWGAMSAETRAAFAEHFMVAWRAAVAQGNGAERDVLRSRVEAYDTAGVHRNELLGRGALTLSGTAGDTDIWLFRYQPYQRLRPGSVPREVPVPWSADPEGEPAPWPDGFRPGDPCILLARVDSMSVLVDAALRAGDLITRINGQPSGAGAFLLSDAELPDGRRLPAGSRVLTCNGIAVEHPWAVRMAPVPADGPDVFTFSGMVGQVRVARKDLSVGDAVALLRDALPRELKLECLRSGSVRNVAVPAGKSLQAEFAATAYPLILGRNNRLRGGDPVVLDPGSYLICARDPGGAIQRFPVHMPRAGSLQLDLGMNRPAGDGFKGPDGFVRLPPVPSLLGSEPEPQPAVWIARRELTNREWFGFVNQPENLRRIEDSLAAGQGPILLPRDPDGQLHQRREGGGWTWKDNFPGFETTAETSVMGVSWEDLQIYLEWRNARTAAEGEPWVYDLPSEQEWELAGHGGLPRPHPWGRRFDPSLAVSAHYMWRFNYDAPGGLELRDESPLGVLELAGGRQEWTRTPKDAGGGAAIYKLKGGDWGKRTAGAFQLSHESDASSSYAAAIVGVRLVARRR